MYLFNVNKEQTMNESLGDWSHYFNGNAGLFVYLFQRNRQIQWHWDNNIFFIPNELIF